MQEHKFKGLGVALVTPFNKNKEVDYSALERLVKHQLSNGTDFLVVMGTTGESVTLSKEERLNVLDFIIDVNKGKLPIVYGMGGNNTQGIIDEIKAGSWNKVDAFLSVAPYYNKPTQDGIYAHFSAISEVSPKPIILYNVPGRTASNILPETVIKLAQNHQNIIAVKEASGSLDQMMQIIKNKPNNFAVLSGDDAYLLAQMALGADGVISVIANAYPTTFGLIANNKEGAYEAHYELVDLINAIFEQGNPAGIKEVLAYLNIMETHLRLPLVNVDQNLKNKIYQLMAEMKS